MSYTPEQFNRLPKWAQSLVKKAERDIEYAASVQKEVAKNAGDAAMLALDPIGTERMSWRGPVVAFREFYERDGGRIPVARERDTVTFVLTDSDRDYINVDVRDGTLQIHGNGVLVTRHHASNTFNVTLDDLRGKVAK